MSVNSAVEDKANLKHIDSEEARSLNAINNTSPHREVPDAWGGRKQSRDRRYRREYPGLPRENSSNTFDTNEAVQAISEMKKQEFVDLTQDEDSEHERDDDFSPGLSAEESQIGVVDKQTPEELADDATSKPKDSFESHEEIDTFPIGDASDFFEAQDVNEADKAAPNLTVYYITIFAHVPNQMAYRRIANTTAAVNESHMIRSDHYMELVSMNNYSAIPDVEDLRLNGTALNNLEMQCAISRQAVNDCLKDDTFFQWTDERTIVLTPFEHRPPKYGPLNRLKHWLYFGEVLEENAEYIDVMYYAYSFESNFIPSVIRHKPSERIYWGTKENEYKPSWFDDEFPLSIIPPIAPRQ
ncbi:hypothetical protein CYMTET_55085 [Cymbomonas tetramitiformis]|uniref:Uncharacterized protein n=1 Tax=Cymbomonas tetramitiformis TaxID=36881 RepID=A0AAE0ENK9_9CHLO|nr:hypothetical protein CYMTET_55085 [Cymbomonas tetramitiformis]|eukprot:gene331-602_t